jgi:hypothetical protein
MPLWLDLLRTPMAAPETAALRRLRLSWQALCLGSALVVGLFSPLRHVIGRAAPLLAAILLVATVICTAIYFVLKQRADKAHLETSGGGE